MFDNAAYFYNKINEDQIGEGELMSKQKIL